MIRIALVAVVICAADARSVKYRPDGTCGVRDIFKECPGTTCIQRWFDEDNCMTCLCDPSKNIMGDMVLSPEAISFIVDGNRDKIAKGADPTRKLYNTIPSGDRFIIPYSFSSDLTQATKDVIGEAMREMEQKCCFTFRQRTNEGDYMFFFRGSGCLAPVGRRTGENGISIGDGCAHKGIVIHEIMHNLGFFHEHQRPDRDNHIKVITANVLQNSQDQYKIVRSIDSLGSPYDVGSIMHYDAYAFAINPSTPTMTFLNGSALTGLQQSQLSVYDADQIAKLYNCNAPTNTTTAAVTTTTTTTLVTSATTNAPVATTNATVATTTGTSVATTTTMPVATTIGSTATTNTTTPNTNVTTTSTLATTSGVPNLTCLDKDGACPYYATVGFCTDPRFSRIVEGLCPNSCGVCSQQGAPCLDLSNKELCAAWKDHCGRKEVTMTCKKTCGLC